jgi:ABC-type histidine transport system ATPase subunit
MFGHDMRLDEAVQTAKSRVCERPFSSTNDQNVEVVRVVMAKGRRLSVMIAEEMSLCTNAVHRILTDHLHMRKICAKLVPKNLFAEQKSNRLEICQDLLGRLEIEPDYFHFEILTYCKSF